LLYGVNWQDPQQYDLVVNLERIGIEAACDLIAVAARSPGLTPTDDGRKALEDLSLSCRVWAALARNPQTRSAGLQVTADDGNVVITGNIGSAKAKEAISQIAQSVDGVRKLSNEVGMGSDWYW
jgi:osmotically-inducible protein OsmY